MIKSVENYIARNLKNKYYIFIIICFCIVFGLGIWKVLLPKTLSFLSDFFNTQTSKNLEQLDIYSITSDQMSDKNIALLWSKTIYTNIDKSVALPRVFLDYIPKNIDEYNTSTKKKLFISILLPVIILGNELILIDRELMKIAFLDKNVKNIQYYSKKYRIKNFKTINFFEISLSQMNEINEELLQKINIIPISMILAQAAIESGWGSSRFVKEGNALFGEWTWKKNSGLKPKDNKDAKFSVKVFDNILDSINSYMLNLNSHPAYKKMRHYRTITLKEGNVLSGYDTSNYLDQYAEIGYEYVLKVTSMIKNNKFDSFDNIKLEKLN